MEVHTKFFNILSDNEQIYFAKLKGILESVDEYSSLQITRAPTHFSFRLIPSVPKYTNSIIDALTQFHNTIGVRLNFSKSIKATGSINFKISLSE